MGEKIRFYKVAYIDKQNKCVNEKAINEQIEKLKEIVQKVQQEPKELTKIKNKLSEIDFLFKGDEYEYEKEVRIVISKNNIVNPNLTTKTENPNDTCSPRIYCETLNIVPFIKTITIGPKVERPEEWGANFSYALEKRDVKPAIVISTLPYK